MATDGGTKQGKINQIANWLGQATSETKSGQDVDRVLARITEDLESLVDNSLSASTNYEIIKDDHGLVPKTEFEAYLRDMEERARQRVRDEIEAQFDEYGVEAVVDAIAGIGDPPADLQRRVDDVLEEVPPDAYDAALQDHLGELLEVLGSDVAITDAERLRDLEEAAREAAGPGPEAGREEVLAEFGRAFGQQFADVDAAIDALRDRLERAAADATTDDQELSPADQRAADAIDLLER